MEQEVEAEMWKYNISFENIGDPQNQLTITLLEAMRTNKTVRSLELWVRYLREEHLTVISDLLLENDMLQSLTIHVEEKSFSITDMRMTFLREMDWNISLQEFAIRCLKSVHEEWDDDADLDWKVDLGASIYQAISRNREAFAMARRL